MTIDSIESIFVDDDNIVNITAFVEDCVLVYNQTLYDPPEYGPALCESNFQLEEDEVLPEEDDELIKYLEKLDLDWKLIDNSDYYLD